MLSHICIYISMFCSICQYSDEQNTYELECGHSFHLFCVRQWLWERSECPLCKRVYNPLLKYMVDGKMTRVELERVERLAVKLKEVIDEISNRVEGLSEFMVSPEYSDLYFSEVTMLRLHEIATFPDNSRHLKNMRNELMRMTKRYATKYFVRRFFSS